MKSLKRLQRFTSTLLAKEKTSPGLSITLEVINCCIMESQTSLEELGGIDEVRKIVNLHPELRPYIDF